MNPSNLSGYWFPPGSAARTPARLELDRRHFTLHRDGMAALEGDGCQLIVSDRIGNIARTLILPDHSVFETRDNDTVDTWLQHTSHRDRTSQHRHQLESRWRWILAALLVTVVLGFVTVSQGMPWASERIARALPPALNETIAARTLETMDELMLQPTRLTQAKQDELTRRFEQKLLPLQHEPFRYRLHFRHYPQVPNAFALPSGDIVVTDALVKLVRNPEELDAVLLHEIGHVVNRHGLRQVLQTSFMTVALIMVTGDVTILQDWGLALPVFLLQSHYSRRFETEADQFAFERMLEAGIDPGHFAGIIGRMTRTELADPARNDVQNTRRQQRERSLEYLRSHPATDRRMKKALEYSRRFRAGQAE
ncbi:MAG: M48 family metallopeptidase [Thiothrix sp.]|nr:M48 family metallopeptidase [Thiothrix sp.]HPQ94413.1 M48 family metallopeptidase [Thiolinea sp.]